MKFTIRKKFTEKSPQFVADYLINVSELSKMKIKKTIEVGGLWIKRKDKKKKERVKKIKTQLFNGDFIEFYYDDQLQFVDEKECFEVYKGKGFGVWYKPVGMLSDGSPYADKGSLSYAIKKQGKKCFLIQRLDREVSGLILVAYMKDAASFYSKELQNSKIEKFYNVEVLGHIEEAGKIDIDLDEKESHTEYVPIKHKDNTTILEVQIKTGRYHQIRRHFNLIEHPVIGDPKYGQNNKNKTGLKLEAVKLGLFDKTLRKRVIIEVPKENQMFITE